MAPDAPDIDWSAPQSPRARSADDHYFSAHDPLGETRAVYLGGIDADGLFRAERRPVIAELGFGSGLSFLATWAAWRAAVKPANDQSPAHLHYVSIEAAPLEATDAARLRALALGEAADPELAELDARLTAAWPPRVRGVLRIDLTEDVRLTLAHLPVLEALEALHLRAHAWFLDGFAPARNPDMWRAEVMAQVAAKSVVNARAASFSVAGLVRRNLADAGFDVARKPGFGHKRERLEARLLREAQPALQGPFAFAPARAFRTAPSAQPDALVIGAGLAGAAVARALTRRGLRVRVLEARPAPAQAASGNRVGLVMPRLDLDDRPLARLHRSAFLYALGVYEALGGGVFQPIGVRQSPRSSADQDKLAALATAQALPPGLASALPSGLMHHRAGVACPPQVVAAFLRGADLVCDAAVVSLERKQDAWVARNADGDTLGSAPLCVLASGPAIGRFAPCAKVRPSRGQITLAPMDPWSSVEGERAATGPARAFGGYAIPTPDGLWFGATYDAWEGDGDPLEDAASDARNLDELARHAPDLAAALTGPPERARASVRATTADHAPYAGPAPDEAAFALQFAALAKGRDVSGLTPPLREGLFVLGGLGSRGLTLAPLLAEAIAAEALGEPWPIEAGARGDLHPARTLVRRLKRGG